MGGRTPALPQPASSGAEATRVIAIVGPTGSGKTAVAEAVAARIPASLISADSMQVYRGLRILTNQPETGWELVGLWPLDHEASVGEYQRLAHAAIDRALASRRTPVVAGGTGLYLRAALAELELPPAVPPERRTRLESVYDRLGPERAHALLASRDPEAARRVHPNDRRRVVRALELASVGTSLVPDQDRLWAAETRRPTVVVGLDVDPGELEERIARRTAAMFDAGVVEEARRALDAGLSRTARHAIGLREALELERDEAIAAIVRRTRRYAAYQRKWMRRIPNALWLDGARPAAAIAEEIVALASERRRP